VTGLLFAAVAWIGTWGTAPVYADPGQSFQADTLRQVVHVSIGGSHVRVRFTNRFGDTPIVIGSAAVALQGSGAAPRAGTQRRLTFMGASSATIPPHADMYSDPVALQTPAQSNVLVDMYLPDPTGPATEHSLAYQTNYYASGNHTADASPSAFSHTFESWYFLAGVDVSDSHARGAVVALGDSITDGAGGKKNANDRWTDFLSARLLALPPSRQLGVLDAGISGNRILLSDPFFGVNALARLDTDVLSQSGVTDAIVLLGVNDIQENPHQYDPRNIEQGLRQIVMQAHARGLRVIGCTITPYKGWFSYDAQGEATRLAVNEYIRHGGVFDGVADFDAIVRDPKEPHRLLRAYDSGDHLHPNAAAHRAMAAAIPLDAL